MRIKNGEEESEEAMKGQCLEGYGGFMCMDCLYGYSRSADFICSKCASLGLSIFLFILTAAGLFSFIFLILKSKTISFILFRSTIENALNPHRSFLSVYLKIVTNHLQLLIIIYLFNLDWSDQVKLNTNLHLNTVRYLISSLHYRQFQMQQHKSSH